MTLGKGVVYLLLVSLLAGFCIGVGALTGPAAEPLPSQPIVYIGVDGTTQCKLCEIPCEDNDFLMCKSVGAMPYYRYGCALKTPCVSTNSVTRFEHRAAIMLCLTGNGCKLRSFIENDLILESASPSHTTELNKLKQGLRNSANGAHDQHSARRITDFDFIPVANFNQVLLERCLGKAVTQKDRELCHYWFNFRKKEFSKWYQDRDLMVDKPLGGELAADAVKRLDSMRKEFGEPSKVNLEYFLKYRGEVMPQLNPLIPVNIFFLYAIASKFEDLEWVSLKDANLMYDRMPTWFRNHFRMMERFGIHHYLAVKYQNAISKKVATNQNDPTQVGSNLSRLINLINGFAMDNYKAVYKHYWDLAVIHTKMPNFVRFASKSVPCTSKPHSSQMPQYKQISVTNQNPYTYARSQYCQLINECVVILEKIQNFENTLKTKYRDMINSFEETFNYDHIYSGRVRSMPFFFGFGIIKGQSANSFSGWASQTGVIFSRPGSEPPVNQVLHHLRNDIWNYHGYKLDAVLKSSPSYTPGNRDTEDAFTRQCDWKEIQSFQARMFTMKLENAGANSAFVLKIYSPTRVWVHVNGQNIIPQGVIHSATVNIPVSHFFDDRFTSISVETTSRCGRGILQISGSWQNSGSSQSDDNTIKCGDRIRLQGHHGANFLTATSTGCEGGCARFAPSEFGSVWTVTCLGSAVGVVRRDQLIGLKSAYGRYLVAEPNGNLHANRGHLQQWEQFQVFIPGATTELQNGIQIGLKSHHNHFVVHEQNNDANANRGHFQAWEHLRITKV